MKVHQTNLEGMISDFFEHHSWGSPKQIIKYANQRLNPSYSWDTLKRKVHKILKTKYLRHPYFAIYFKNKFDLQVFNLYLRLGWFKMAFEEGEHEVEFGTMPKEWSKRLPSLKGKTSNTQLHTNIYREPK